MSLRQKPYRALSFFLLCAAVTTLAQAPKKFPFEKKDMPFKQIAVEHPIDRDCAAEGTAKTNTAAERARQAQNRAKNRFDAQGAPVPILIADFDRLEKATVRARNCWAKKQTGCRKLELETSSGMPANREQLHDIATTAAGAKVGEGTIVSLEAKVKDSHYSNTKYNFYGVGDDGKPDFGEGESVNCKGVPSKSEAASIQRNDIHIVLVVPGETDNCMSVTAEISPHYRPKLWERFHDMGPTSHGTAALGNKDVNSEARRVNFGKLKLVRITGPLFYDASHEPCSPGHTSVSPKRRSLWEIHPAYKLEVQTLSGQWMSFEDWAATQ